MTRHTAAATTLLLAGIFLILSSCIFSDGLVEHTANDFDPKVPFNQSQFEQQIVDQVNAHRISIGLNALTVNPAIARECRTVAFGHDGKIYGTQIFW